MNSIVKKIYRSKDIENIQRKIDLLGYERRVKFDAIMFMNSRIVSTIILGLMMIFLTKVRYIFIPIILVIYYYLFYYIFITREIKKRIQKLDMEALTFFEILALTLQTGKSLENSLEITCYNIDSELSREFKRSLLEIKFGKSLVEALNGLKKRIPSESINNIILNIEQTSIFGNNIISVMNNQVDYLREKQIMDIKSQINKIPNKVSIISVIFIVPLILLIVLGPFIINLLG